MIFTRSYINNIYDLHNILDEVKPFKFGEIEFSILLKKFKGDFSPLVHPEKKRQDRILRRIFGTKNGPNLPYLEGKKKRNCHI
jgi:hypothetical protein